MAAPAALWFQRLPADLRRRLDLAEAAAREDRTATHAAQAVDLVAVLAPRMPFDEALERYIEITRLDGDEAGVVHTRALKLLSDQQAPEELARRGGRRAGFDWRYFTPGGAVRFVQRQRRRTAEEDLWLELAAARAEEALVRMHVRHAQAFVDLLDTETDPARAVSLYIDHLGEPESRSRAIYQRTLAELADGLLPRLFAHASPDAEPGPR